MTVRMDRNMLLVNSNIQYTCVLDGDLNVYLLVGEVQHTTVFLFKEGSRLKVNVTEIEQGNMRNQKYTILLTNTPFIIEILQKFILKFKDINYNANVKTDWAWMSVCFECCVLSGRGLCDELITRPEESYRLWCVVVCDLQTS